jgi:hypothetical protein
VRVGSFGTQKLANLGTWSFDELSECVLRVF